MLKLNCDDFKIFVSNQSDYVLGSRLFKRESCLSDDHYRPTSHHAVVVYRNQQEVASHLLCAAGGASAVHLHSALCYGNRLFVAVGKLLCALEISTLNVVWKTQSDEATCFGVYLPPHRDCLISHGEMEIARLNFEGKIEWQSGGADIFTGEVEVFEDYVEAVDFNGWRYRFDIESGKSEVISRP